MEEENNALTAVEIREKRAEITICDAVALYLRTKCNTHETSTTTPY